MSTFKKISSFKCKDCDYWGPNELSMKVHYGRNHAECGLCDFIAKYSEYLEMHLTTCEIFSCQSCDIEFNHLDGLKKDKEEKHKKKEIWITHSKLDRKHKDCIAYTSHKSKNLFSRETRNSLTNS